MSYIPNRHCPVKGGYDYNTLSEYEKGLLDGMDLVILDDSIFADNGRSLFCQAIDHAYREEMSDLERACFDKLKKGLIREAEQYIDSMGNKLYTTMCEREEPKNAPEREYGETGGSGEEP